MDPATLRNAETGSPGPDDGLRRMMVWVLAALVFCVTAAALMAHLAIRWFDVP